MGTWGLSDLLDESKPRLEKRLIFFIELFLGTCFNKFSATFVKSCSDFDVFFGFWEEKLDWPDKKIFFSNISFSHWSNLAAKATELSSIRGYKNNFHCEIQVKKFKHLDSITKKYTYRTFGIDKPNNLEHWFYPTILKSEKFFRWALGLRIYSLLQWFVPIFE